MDYVELLEWFPTRISELRYQKGVSARDMSLSLGQGESYINKIENRHALPSIPGFFYICEYFGITPHEFFDMDNNSPSQVQDLVNAAKGLSSTQLEHLIHIVEDISGNSS